MRRQLIHAIYSLLLLASSNARAAEAEEEAMILHRDIVLINMLNGLNLTPEQNEGLLSKVREAQRVRTGFEAQKAQMSTARIDDLTELKSLLDRSGPIPEELAAKVHRASSQSKDAHLQYRRSMTRLQEEAAAILTENQRHVLRQFKPCLIPPKQGVIGQDPAAAAKGLGEFLERFRQMPDRQARHAAHRFTARHMSRFELEHGPPSDDELAAERERIFALLEDARQISDVDFMIQKPRIAAEIVPGSEEFNRKGSERAKIGRLLLDERLIALLEDRMADQ